MSGRRQLPPIGELKAMRDDGMKMREIAEKVFEQTGERVSAAAVSAALTRAGYGDEPTRYNDLIPWRVQMGHQKHYLVRMLRLEARRRAGLTLELGQERRLDALLAEMKEKDAVISYNPNKEPGFSFQYRRHGIDTDIIRRPDDEAAESLAG